MFSSIAYEQIHDDYWFADYLGFKVVMMKTSGYINATKLCLCDGKRFDNWIRLYHSQDLVKFFEAKLFPANQKRCLISEESLSTNRVIQTVKGGNNTQNLIVSGTYVHPKLIVHIASWVSFDFAYKVSIIVEEFVQ